MTYVTSRYDLSDLDPGLPEPSVGYRRFARSEPTWITTDVLRFSPSVNSRAPCLIGNKAWCPASFRHACRLFGMRGARPRCREGCVFHSHRFGDGAAVLLALYLCAFFSAGPPPKRAGTVRA
jgi:hypothetical protein